MKVEREWFDKFLNSGFVDTFRKFHPNEKNQFTQWFGNLARRENRGERLDYIVANTEFAEMQVTDAGILPTMHGSDHCPIYVVVKDGTISI